MACHSKKQGKFMKKQTMNKKISFRSMTIEDVDDVWLIERQSFPNPWTKNAFCNELLHNHFAKYLLSEVEGQIVGYCGIWVIMDEAQITNIAISPIFRNQKLGEALMEKAIEVAKEMGARSMSLEVRVSNIVAQNLYRKFNFYYGGLRKHYYSDNGEDAYVMWVDFDEKR